MRTTTEGDARSAALRVGGQMIGDTCDCELLPRKAEVK